MTQQNQPSSLDREDFGIATLVLAASVAIYFHTAAPGLLPGDGGEFQVLGNLVGHAHTTGYWTYILLARLWAYLPLGTPALCITLFSGLMGAVAMSCLYLAGRLATDDRWAAAIAAAVVATSKTIWSQAVIAEVYTAGAAFAGAVLVLLLQWRAKRRPGYLLAAGVVGGLGLGAHGTVLLLAPAAAVFVLACQPDWRRDLPAALAGGVLGLLLLFGAFCLVDAVDSPHSMIQIAYAPAHSAWGVAEGVLDRPIGRFWFLLSGCQWRSAMFADPAAIMPRNAVAYGGALLRDLGVVGLALTGVGAIALLSRSWRVALLVALGYAVQMLYTLNYSIGDIHVFFVNAQLYAGVGLTAGIAVSIRALRKRLPGRQSFVTLLTSGLLLVTILLTRGTPAPWRLLGNAKAPHELTGVPTVEETERWHASISATVSALEPDALVLLDWYHLYPFVYVANLEQGRTDLRFAEPMPYSPRSGMADSMRSYLVRMARERPIYANQSLSALCEPLFEVSSQQVGSMQLYRYRLVE
ncbi:MAG: protein O-mannosyl-transferase family [Anaerolineae bacterium]